MLKNILIVTIRNLLRDRGYTLVNILGLAAGFAGALAIAVFLRGELSFDKWNPHADRMYRLDVHGVSPEGDRLYAMSAPAMGPHIRDVLPEVEAMARLCPAQESVFRITDHSFAQSYFYADPDVVPLFDLKIESGNASPLNGPGHAILSRSLAVSWFGDEPAVGRQVTFNDGMVLTIDAVFSDMPAASHLSSELFVSIATMTDKRVWGPGALETWRGFNFYTYLLTSRGVTGSELTEKVNRIFEEQIPRQDKTRYSASLDRVDRIYLYSEALYPSGPTGDIRNVMMFMLIALLVVVLAAINFVNLSTARSMNRGREVGIRKVMGSNRGELIGQFLSESVIQALLAFLVAVAAVELALPALQRITGKPLNLDLFQDPIFVGGAIAGALLVGLLAGLYPAFILSGFRPAQVLKGQTSSGVGSARLRSVLVVFQFSVSIILLIGTLAVSVQMNYLMHKDLGFEREQLAYIPLRKPEIKDHVELLEDRLNQSTDVVATSVSSRVLGRVYSGWHLKRPETPDPIQVTALFVDYDFLETFGMKLAAGRTFSRDRLTDKDEAFIINREAAEQLGLSDPVGAVVEMPDIRKGTVIGVVENIHFQSLHRKTEPLMITFSPGPYHRVYLAVRVKPGRMRSFLKQAKSEWQGLYPGIPFDVLFQDRQLEQMYASEKRTGTLVALFSALAVVIGCLGLFALAAFMAHRRAREIGIRKVLGASFTNVVGMLTLETSRLVLLANIVAWPVAWWAVNRWLSGFAYRVAMPWWVFPVAGAAAFLIAWLTVGGQAARAAWVNPTDVLSCE